jgi:dipeptidase D
MPGLVSTSSNIASINFKRNKIIIVTSQRSDSEGQKAHINQHVCKIFEVIGAKIECTNSYPCWTPNPQSPILETVKRAYKDLFGRTPFVRSIHAGLECGLFLEKYPQMDMISFGPTIKDVHSPGEKIHIPSVKRFSDLLLKVLNDVNN